MELRRPVVLLAAMGGLLSTFARAEPRPLDGDPTHGEVLYKKLCAACHGADGQGAKAPALLRASRVNGIADATLLQMLGHGARRGSKHPGLEESLSLLDAWDLIGFLRSRVTHVGDLFPQADRYLAKSYTFDKHARERIKRSLERDVTEDDATAHVFTLFDTGSKTELELVPPDPRQIDRLKRRMKVGYVVFLPFASSAKKPVELGIALEPKQLQITELVATSPSGEPQTDLNKLLSRFRTKGDRRLSGKLKARLAVGGGGRQIKELEDQVTDAYLRALELVTAYEIEERERSWADDDVKLDENEQETSDFSVK